MIARLPLSAARPRVAAASFASAPVLSRAPPSVRAMSTLLGGAPSVSCTASPALPAAAKSHRRRGCRLAPRRPAIQCSAAIPIANQLRFHRTDYEGPGAFGERETGAMHSHEDEVDEEEKQRLRQILQARYTRRSGTYAQRGYTVGIGGPVGSGKTALTLALCRALRDRLSMGVVTNDIFTQEDAEFLVRNDALGRSRIMPVETGGCPHAAIREDVSANLGALETLTRRMQREGNGDGDSDATGEPLLLCESGGDNLAANFSSELADYTIYVIDVAGGDKVPRKGGPGITQSDLLVINKIDLAEAVGSSLEVMERDADKMRRGVQGGESGPTVFASVKNGVGVENIIGHIMRGFEGAHRLVESAR